MMKIGKWASVLAVCSLLFGMYAAGSIQAQENAAAGEQAAETGGEATGGLPEYAEYLAGAAGVPDGIAPLSLPAAEASVQDGAERKEIDGGGPALVWANGTGTASWTVEAPADGLYALKMEYYALEGRGTDLRFSLLLDGAVPYRQAENFTFTRLFRDVLTQDGAFERDRQDNELKPQTEEIKGWQTAAFLDADGLYAAPLRIYLKKGTHVLALSGLGEPAAVREVTLFIPEETAAYDALGLKPQAFEGDSPALIRIPAEKMLSKSRSSITVDTDRSTPATEPYHPSKIRINVMGGSQWAKAGDKVTWEFTVDTPGWYTLGARYRQNFVRGFYVSRRIEVDGKPLCRELEEQRFSYGINWQTVHFGIDGQEMPFYFKAGTHTISMEVTLGSMEETIRAVDKVQERLNEMYRKIIMITGVQPDPYRDYTLSTDIPELLSVFSYAAEELEKESARLEATTGRRGSEAALVDRLAEQLRSFAAQPHTIADRLTKFRENVSGLMDWLNSIKDQPLELDYLYLCPLGTEKPAAGAGFWAQLVHEVKAFLGTFMEDYSSIGGTDGGRPLEVWVSTSRDMAYTVNRLIQNDFTPRTDISVSLKLVNSGLLQAIMAGREPDAALGLGRGLPVNLAMRGALEPLGGFTGFEETASWFHTQALVPYTYRGAVYALPEQQTFHMMFVRTDIFEELGLSVPETWEDLYQAARVLQRKNLQIGLPYLTTDANNLVNTGMSAQNIFPTLLAQRGGRVFQEDQTGTALDTPEALEAFEEWVSFYTQYSFPLLKDDYNRFRTGEMPLTISMYTFYSQLIMAAPEIRNDWVMVPIPGIRQEDGSINRTEYASGTACVMLANREKREDAWKFLQWWVSAGSQAEYGRMVEAMLGPIGRYATANLEAFEQLAWPEKDAASIKEQWMQIKEMPEVPGGYYVARDLDNAFRACVYRRENTRETLQYWNKSSNEEIRRKRREFHLD